MADTSQEIVPRTTDEWLAAQTGVTIFRTPDGRTGISFEPNFAQRFNFLAPISQVVQLDNNWKPDPRMVQLDPRKHAYKRKGKWDVSKQGLLLLANLAGIDKDGDPIWTDLGKQGFRVTVKAKQRKSDGTYRRDSGTITIIWARAEAKVRRESDGPDVEKRVDEWYEAIHQKSETRAYLRAIRNLLSLPGEFTEKELTRPFFVIGYVFVPDWANPKVSKLLELQFREGSHELFGEAEADEETVTPELPTGSTITEEDLTGWGEDEPEDPGDVDEADGDLDAAIDADDEFEDFPEDAGEESQEEPPEPTFDKPVNPFTPTKGDYAGMSVEDIVDSGDGRVWLAGAIKRMRDPVKKQQGLDWLSWKLQREITLDGLDQVA